MSDNQPEQPIRPGPQTPLNPEVKPVENQRREETTESSHSLWKNVKGKIVPKESPNHDYVPLESGTNVIFGRTHPSTYGGEGLTEGTKFVTLPGDSYLSGKHLGLASGEKFLFITNYGKNPVRWRTNPEGDWNTIFPGEKPVPLPQGQYLSGLEIQMGGEKPGEGKYTITGSEYFETDFTRKNPDRLMEVKIERNY